MFSLCSIWLGAYILHFLSSSHRKLVHSAEVKPYQLVRLFQVLYPCDLKLIGFGFPASILGKIHQHVPKKMMMGKRQRKYRFVQTVIYSRSVY